MGVIGQQVVKKLNLRVLNLECYGKSTKERINLAI